MIFSARFSIETGRRIVQSGCCLDGAVGLPARAGPALIHSLWARIEQGIWAVQGIRWQDLMWLFLVWLCVERGIAAAAEPPPPTGPLARYVAQPDASYAWQVRRRGQVSRSEYVE